MMKNKVMVVVVVSVLVVLTLTILSAFVRSRSEKLIRPQISLERLRERLPGVEIRMETIPIKDPSVIKEYGSDTLEIYLFGSPPKFVSERERGKWFEKLVRLADLLEGPDVPYWGPKGVSGHGVGHDGYYHVSFAYNTSFTEDMMVEIFEAINRAAKRVGFETLVPVYFGRSGPARLDSRAALTT